MDVLIQRQQPYSALMMATSVKPKERQFQVVPVPAIFTRGRWECRDFKEATSVESQILEFVDKHPSTLISASTDAEHNTPTTYHLPLVGENTRNIILTGLPSPSSSVSTMIGNNDTGSGQTNATAVQTTDGNTVVVSMSGTNNVAIDNKIEQAMDLVKTHLTFAVREEVEILRSQISDLEKQVTNLENENQILRQFAPSDIVANLPLLIQNQQQQHKMSQQVNHPASDTFQHSHPNPTMTISQSSSLPLPNSTVQTVDSQSSQAISSAANGL